MTSKWEEFKLKLKRMIELDPFNSFFYTFYSIILLKLHKFNQALIESKNSMRFYPQASFPYWLSGFILEKLGKLEEALSFYSRAVELNSADPELLGARAKCKLLLKDFSGALEDYNIAASIGNIQEKEFLYNKAMIKFTLGEIDFTDAELESIIFDTYLEMELFKELLLEKLNYGNKIFSFENNIDSTFVYGKAILPLSLEGDLLNLNKLNESKIYFMIGDAASIGTSASILNTSILKLMHYVLEENNNPNFVMNLVNRVISKHLGFHRKSKFKTYVTSIFGTVFKESGRVFVSFCNAGHFYPLLYRNGTWTELRVKGMPLGVVEELNYEIGKLELFPLDILFFYTDGVTERTNNLKEFFGMERLQNCISKNENKSSKDIVNNLLLELERFAEGQKLEDDISVICIKTKLD